MYMFVRGIFIRSLIIFQMSGEEMINQFLETRDWKNAKIRVIAWHPHADKFAVAYKDDTIQVRKSRKLLNSKHFSPN